MKKTDEVKAVQANTKEKVVIGVGLAAVAAAAAGVYFLYGSKDAAKKRKAIKSWALKMKAEVLEKIEKLKDLDEATYTAIIETARTKYEAAKGVEAAEVAAIAKELGGHWKAIKNTMHPAPKKKAAKKVVAKKTIVK